MTTDRVFSDLIGRIYDCALDTNLWPEVLAEISASLRGSMADIGVMDPVEGTTKLAASYNVPADLAEKVRAHAHINPLAPLGLTAPLGKPMCTSRDLDLEAFHNSSFWKACFDGLDYYDHIAVPLIRQASSFGYMGVTGSRERGAFDAEDVELARLIAPHVRRSVEISGVLGNERVEAAALGSALHALSAAAIILGPDASIRFRNGQAAAEFERGTILRERAGRLLGVTPEATRLTAQLRDHAGERHRRGRDSRLTDQAGRVLHATWVTLHRGREHKGGASVLLLLREPEADLTTPLSATAAQFTLTAAETQVLAQVLNGHTLADVATILGVARSTVKSHVDAIYRKTGTRRQAELVRLVLGFASPLR
ncbi:MAG TPA: LuxR C-terminal-related transcriptional regulator [Microvirga sp.]|jgi:DNA-binding CsgD family transcriptional regulator|nr:LuxR C-terminal-related transcriptional regulator [Microvirga sp.]